MNGITMRLAKKAMHQGRSPKHAAGDSLQRAIPKGFKFNPRHLKSLAKADWQLNVGLGHIVAGLAQITKIKSHLISPDGLIGGRGYTMSLRDIRQRLSAAVEALSDITDALHDEMHAPHWQDTPKPKDVQKIMDKADEVAESPIDKAEEEFDEEFEEIGDE